MSTYFADGKSGEQVVQFGDETLISSPSNTIKQDENHPSSPTQQQDTTLPAGEDSTLPGGEDNTLPGGEDGTLPGEEDSTLPGREDSALPGREDITLLDDKSSCNAPGFSSKRKVR